MKGHDALNKMADGGCTAWYQACQLNAHGKYA